MQLLVGVCLGIGLAAACGFRVFVPMFALSLATHAGLVPLSDSFAWLATWPAIIALGTATVFETGAYYIPWLDNALDTVATPAAMAAGVLMTAAAVTDADPLLRWSAALIAGAGVAGTVQAASVTTRAGSTLTTGGLGNFAVATVELLGSIVMSVLAMLLPIVTAALAIGLIGWGLWFLLHRRTARPKSYPS